jgi:hypothetical protein
MKPTIGRIVIYNATNEQLVAMENSYKNTGKGCNVQSKLPAIIVAVWSDVMVNLKVITDGQDDLWVTSSHQGDGAGEWQWPVIET